VCCLPAFLPALAFDWLASRLSVVCPPACLAIWLAVWVGRLIPTPLGICRFLAGLLGCLDDVQSLPEVQRARLLMLLVEGELEVLCQKVGTAVLFSC
jgi:hypothetical protein